MNNSVNNIKAGNGAAGGNANVTSAGSVGATNNVSRVGGASMTNSVGRTNQSTSLNMGGSVGNTTYHSNASQLPPRSNTPNSQSLSRGIPLVHSLVSE